MSATDVVEVSGHIIDSLILAKVLDVILASDADYRVVDVEIGKTNVDTSRAQALQQDLTDQSRLADGLMHDLTASYSEGQGGRGT